MTYQPKPQHWIILKDMQELSRKNAHRIKEREYRERDKCREQVKSFIKTSAECGFYEAKICKYNLRIPKKILDELKDAGFGVGYSYEKDKFGIERSTHYLIKWDKNYAQDTPIPSLLNRIIWMFRTRSSSVDD